MKSYEYITHSNRGDLEQDPNSLYSDLIDAVYKNLDDDYSSFVYDTSGSEIAFEYFQRGVSALVEGYYKDCKDS